MNVAEIVNERKVILNLLEDRELARQKNDISTMKECDALLGKYLAMFTDRQDVKSSIEFTEEEKTELDRIRKSLGMDSN